MSESYHPENYWSDVARRIAERDGDQVMAGDDSPFYRYKRKRFIHLLDKTDFQNKDVLELGSGPGGNLGYLRSKNCKSLTGADISDDMIQLSTRRLKDTKISLVKIDGTTLPFKDGQFDIVFCSTVLQHNTSDDSMQSILEEMCRVCKHELLLFERIEKKTKGNDLCVGRTEEHYKSICEANGLMLTSVTYSGIIVSNLAAGAFRRTLDRNRKEGEPISSIAQSAENITLPVTKLLDKIITSKRELARLHFIRS